MCQSFLPETITKALLETITINAMFMHLKIYKPMSFTNIPITSISSPYQHLYHISRPNSFLPICQYIRTDTDIKISTPLLLTIRIPLHGIQPHHDDHKWLVGWINVQSLDWYTCTQTPMVLTALLKHPVIITYILNQCCHFVIHALT